MHLCVIQAFLMILRWTWCAENRTPKKHHKRKTQDSEKEHTYLLILQKNVNHKYSAKTRQCSKTVKRWNRPDSVTAFSYLQMFCVTVNASYHHLSILNLNMSNVQRWADLVSPDLCVVPLLFWATFARQRQTELLYPRRGGCRAGCPADGVWVISFKQSFSLFGTGQLSNSLAGYVVSYCFRDGPVHWALPFELGVVMLRGWKDN